MNNQFITIFLNFLEKELLSVTSLYMLLNSITKAKFLFSSSIMDHGRFVLKQKKHQSFFSLIKINLYGPKENTFINHKSLVKLEKLFNKRKII